jgi:hypothetical protein
MTGTMVAEGDFSFIQDSMSRTALSDAYTAIQKAEAWDLVKAGPGNGGFMFGGHDIKAQLAPYYVDSLGHSGSSYAWTFRSMERLAKVGWTAFVAEFIANQTK